MIKSKRVITGVSVAIASLVVLTGVAVALVRLTQDVPASVDITVVAPEGIEIYLDEALENEAGSINFGNVDVDAFGTPVGDVAIVPVWVNNISLSTSRVALYD